MADAVEDAMDEINNRLYDNLISNNYKEFAADLCLKTKERIVKDYYLSLNNKLFDALNKEFEDVKFRYKWDCGGYKLNSDMHRISRDYYDKDYTDDIDDFDDLYNDEPDKDIFYRATLQEINIKIEYYWERKCSLGCLHSTKRFYIVNMPKLIDLVSSFKLGMPVRNLVKEFIPDFFYDPTRPPKKRGRPKSSRS